jgi:hypothetical protein
VRSAARLRASASRPSASRRASPRWSSALGHHQHARDLVAVAAAHRPALRTGPLQLHLRGPCGLLGRGTVALGPVKLDPHVVELGVHPAVGGGLGAAAGTLQLGAELVVFLDEADQLLLDLVQEGVDLFLVEAPLAERRLLESDVVHVRRGERHQTLLVVGRRPRSDKAD